MPFLHVTARIKGRKHDGLLAEKGLRFTPSVAILDPKGGMLASKAGVLDMAALEQLAAKAQRTRRAFLDLRAKAGAGDEHAKQRFELMEMELGHVTYADYRTRNPDLSKLHDDVREAVQMAAGEALVQEVEEHLKALRAGRSKFAPTVELIGEKLLAGVREGAEPFDDDQRIRFYYYLGDAGAKLNRAEMIDAAVEGLTDDAEDNEKLTATLEKWKAQSAKIKTDATPK